MGSLSARGARVALAGLASWVLACGGESSRGRTIEAPSPTDAARAAVVADPGGELFADACVGCHDDPGPSRPDFAIPMTHPMASRALRAVIDGAMPPPPASGGFLPSSQRLVLIRWLCARSGRSGDACERLVRFDQAPPIMRAGPTVMQEIHRRKGATVSEDTAALLIENTPTGAPRTLRDAQHVSSVLLVALEACGAAPAAAVVPPNSSAAVAPSAAGSDRQACTNEVVTRSLTPPIAGAGGSR